MEEDINLQKQLKGKFKKIFLNIENLRTQKAPFPMGQAEITLLDRTKTENENLRFEIPKTIRLANFRATSGLKSLKIPIHSLIRMQDPISYTLLLSFHSDEGIHNHENYEITYTSVFNKKDINEVTDVKIEKVQDGDYDFVEKTEIKDTSERVDIIIYLKKK